MFLLSSCSFRPSARYYCLWKFNKSKPVLKPRPPQLTFMHIDVNVFSHLFSVESTKGAIIFRHNRAWTMSHLKVAFCCLPLAEQNCFNISHGGAYWNRPFTDMRKVPHVAKSQKGIKSFVKLNDWSACTGLLEFLAFTETMFYICQVHFGSFQHQKS